MQGPCEIPILLWGFLIKVKIPRSRNGPLMEPLRSLVVGIYGILEGSWGSKFASNIKPRSALYHSGDEEGPGLQNCSFKHAHTWVVVKIRAPFRDPKRDHNFDNHLWPRTQRS